MRFLRLRHGGIDYFARLVDDATARLWTAAPWGGGIETDRLVPLRPGAFLPPVTPTKIVCVGRNYAEHARELGNEVPKEPLLFFKPPSSLLPHAGVVKLPPESARVEHEGEIAVVIGERIHRVPPERAEAAIFGVTCADDVTARDIQRADVQFTRGKGFDTFCPVGPFIETEPGPLTELDIALAVNGEVRQRGVASQMLWSIPDLLAYIARVMTLEPGDLVLTGTPAGVGALAPGDVVKVECSAVGALEHGVAALEP